MIINERESRHDTIIEIAKRIMVAGRTAPKARGVDNIEIVTLLGETIKKLSAATHEEGLRNNMSFFLRDAENILSAEAVILIGTRSQTMGLNCGYCGFETCQLKDLHPGVPCTMNTIDLGIAIGSMTAQAADNRVDCRVMYSLGSVAQELGWLKECNSIIAIPISASTKNPFFDRPTHK